MPPELILPQQWADDRPTLLDIAKHSGNDGVVGLIDEAARAVPEILTGSARGIKGTSYKTLVRTGLPTVSFRNANEGATRGKSTFVNRRFESYILNPRWECDKAVADAHDDGPAAYIAIEAAGQVEASLQHIGSQFYYGTGNDAKGFAGLAAAYSDSLEVDAQGSSAKSSVWAVKWGPRAVQFVYGNDGRIVPSDLRIGDAKDADGNLFTAYIQEIMAWVGLQVADTRAIGRIKNLAASTQTLTDDLLAQLLSKYPVGMRPDAFYMSRRSLEQLRKSRTATNATGTPAPTPTEYEGIPIYPSESISDNETV